MSMLYVLHVVQVQKAKADSVGNYLYFTAGSSTGVICNTTSTQLVATSTGSRIHLAISNDSPNMLYLGFGTAAIMHQGQTVPASTTVTLDNPTYMGAVTCISAGASSSTIEEYK